MFRWKRYINQDRPNILHSKVLATCIAILGAHPNTIRSINEILSMSVNRYYIRAKNIAAYSFNSHQLEQLFATSQVGGIFHDRFFNSELKFPNSEITTALYQQ